MSEIYNDLEYKENCYLNLKTFDENIYLFIEHEFYPCHGHYYTEMLWRLYYYFELSKNGKVILLLKNGGEFNFFLEYLNIQHQFTFRKNLTISDSNNTGLHKCRHLYLIKNNTNFECDINDFQKDNFEDKIFFYRNRIRFIEDDYKVNLTNYFDVGNKFFFMVDKIKQKLENEKIPNKYIKNKIYFSRRKDVPQKFYYVDNIKELSNFIVSNNFFEISPLSKLDIVEKLYYVNNCDELILEHSSALNYAFFAKPQTKIYIILPSYKAYKNSPIVLSLIHKFKNVKLINGYDNIPKIWDFSYYQKFGFHNNVELTTFLGFYFPDDEKMKEIFNDEFKFYESKRMILHDQLIENIKPIWNDLGFWENYKKFLDTKKYSKFKVEGRIYEYVNSELREKKPTNEELKLLNIFPKVDEIPGNTINRRFILRKDELNYIINKCRNNNIDVYPIPYSEWHMNQTVIDIEDVKNLL